MLRGQPWGQNSGFLPHGELGPDFVEWHHHLRDSPVSPWFSAVVSWEQEQGGGMGCSRLYAEGPFMGRRSVYHVPLFTECSTLSSVQQNDF